MTQMSSAQAPTFGNSSLTSSPLCPYRFQVKGDDAIAFRQRMVERAGALTREGGLLVTVTPPGPEAAYLVGASAGLRYHFRTGTKFVPFIGGSFGIAVTDIGDPDASGKFQFHEQVGTGLHYLISNQYAVSCEYAYWHISNGGIREPNAGVNNHTVSIGFAWLF